MAVPVCHSEYLVVALSYFTGVSYHFYVLYEGIATWEAGETDPLETIPYGIDPEDAYIARYEAEAVNKAVDSLDTKHAFVIEAWAEGYKGEEIAAELNVTPSRVSQLKKEAMESLRPLKYRLNDYAYSPYWKDL